MQNQSNLQAQFLYERGRVWETMDVHLGAAPSELVVGHLVIFRQRPERAARFPVHLVCLQLTTA